MIIELLSRRAEMSESEHEEAPLAKKHNRPASEPLFQLPPTYNTRSATRRQSLLRLNYTLQNAGGCDPRTPGGDCEATPRTGDARKRPSPNTTKRRSQRSTTDQQANRCSSNHQHTTRANQTRNKRSPGRRLFPSHQTFSESVNHCR